MGSVQDVIRSRESQWHLDFGKIHTRHGWMANTQATSPSSSVRVHKVVTHCLFRPPNSVCLTFALCTLRFVRSPLASMASHHINR